MNQSIHKKYKLLIAEDESLLRENLCEDIKSEIDCDIIEAENGLDAMNTVKRHFTEGNPFDAILTDIKMPKMTGLQMLEKLRQEG